MEKKTTIIIVVAVIAIVVIAAAAFVMTQGGQEKTAKQMADNFIKNSDGSFGNYEIMEEDGDYILLKAVQDLKDKNGNPSTSSKGETTRTSYFKIYSYETKEKAHAAFLDFIENSKNGTRGKTLLDQQDSLGMAGKQENSLIHIYDYREGDAKEFNADHAFVFYASFLSASSAQYTQCCGALEMGKNVVVFNETTNFDIYMNKAIYQNQVTGENCITEDYYFSQFQKFCKWF